MAQAIGKYERDEDVPSSGVLIAPAKALGVSIDYLAGDQDMVLEAVEFRKKQIASKKEQAQVEASALHFIERYLMVEEVLGLPSAHWDKPVDSPYRVRQLVEAEDAARRARESWDLGVDPIPNVIELMEERGVRVVIVDSQANIDGLAAFVRRAGKEPVRVVVLRRDMQGERQRFSLAHELATSMDVEGDDKFRELAAHRFAGAFLMPDGIVRESVGKHRSSIGWSELFALRELFGASMQAIAYRFADLGIFAPALAQCLYREFSRLGYRSATHYEPHSTPAARRRPSTSPTPSGERRTHVSTRFRSLLLR